VYHGGKITKRRRTKDAGEKTGIEDGPPGKEQKVPVTTAWRVL
jgi:hypothetical protein